ncbi:hypothetical protein [Glycomyces buryatensis]|uniref:MFS transporter n=1 Tax=Glycomyces buryatensis TaxID=2570927 RepID=A0A4S8QC25_9ACTN|nr:hypothetical protein [Glycomyces buryatensis]THV41840.1 hypothetical protein FAB82_08950 [Glycomyces buryatensis]
MTTTTDSHRTQRPTAALRWAPVLSATYAQATAFAATAATAFLVTDIAANFGIPSAARLWPLGAFALGLVVAANASRRVGALARTRYTGSASLAALTLSAVALALAPNFGFALGAALALGAASGLVIAIAGRVVIAAEVGDGTGSTVLSALAVLAGLTAGTLSLFALPAFGWRGVLGLLVVASALAAWKFAEHTPHE